MQPAARDAYRRLLDQGWIDTTRHVHPDSVFRGRERPSDHAPAWIDLAD